MTDAKVETKAEHALAIGEFEREKVPKTSVKSYLSFLAVFAGRHTAGTEFMIGPLFLVHGASARNVVFGLFVGNCLATLTWRFWTAPVAIQRRYTTYYCVERICGQRALILYNFFTGALLSMTAGAMCTVSATAVGTLFDVQMPGLHDTFPNSLGFSSIVALVGAVTASIAAFGYTYVSHFSLFLVPYMTIVIVYMAARSLSLLEISSASEFLSVTSKVVWTDRDPEPGYVKFDFWACVLSAWFCDLMLHIGMLDLSILRFGKTERVGWCSAAGMFLGHYFTWLVAGLLYALQLRANPQDTAVKPGPMAHAVAGTNGLLCVLIAGWSTANPLMYAAGLAFQSMLGDRCSTRVATLAAGALAVIAGLFPAVVMRILELLEYGGLVLLPIGVVLFFDCFVNPWLNFQIEAHVNEVTAWPAMVCWSVTTVITLSMALAGILEVYFLPLLGVPIASLTYLGGCWLRDVHLPSRKRASNDKSPGDLCTAPALCP